MDFGEEPEKAMSISRIGKIQDNRLLGPLPSCRMSLSQLFIIPTNKQVGAHFLNGQPNLVFTSLL
jgi:hypothetical protein